MRIAIIGAGAMGSIYGGHLSAHNNVVMVDTSQEVVDEINRRGIVLQETGKDHTFRLLAVTNAKGLEPADLVIVFVKSLYSEKALEQNRNLIGPDTYVMTLQNGSGHENVLSKFVSVDRIIIGTTNDNGVFLGPAYIRHSGVGETCFGLLTGKEDTFVSQLKRELDSSGFRASVSGNIRQLIWDKLFINISLSVVTGILQVDMGYVTENSYAWQMTAGLIHEAVMVAHCLGLKADEDEILRKVWDTSQMSPRGCTSICADLGKGRKTEVEAISGYVVREAKKYRVSVPRHEFVVQIIHAMEGKQTVVE